MIRDTSEHGFYMKQAVNEDGAKGMMVSRKLRSIAREFLNIDIQSEERHHPLEDAEAAMRLYLLREEVSSISQLFIAPVMHLDKHL